MGILSKTINLSTNISSNHSGVWMWTDFSSVVRLLIKQLIYYFTYIIFKYTMYCQFLSVWFQCLRKSHVTLLLFRERERLRIFCFNSPTISHLFLHQDIVTVLWLCSSSSFLSFQLYSELFPLCAAFLWIKIPYLENLY